MNIFHLMLTQSLEVKLQFISIVKKILIEVQLRRCFPGGASGKEPAYQCWRHKRQVCTLSWEDPLEEGMATHSNILA